MTKKKIAILLTLFSLLVVAACSGVQLPWSATATPENALGFQPGANQPVESRLAIGTLMLDDGELAVTAEQASALLPLWKAVKSLSSSETASQEEINALYTQIKESMTAEQVQAIETMELKPEDTQALMDKYDIQLPQFDSGSRPTVSADERATRIAQFQAQGGEQGNLPGGGQGGFPGGGQLPPGGSEGGFPGGVMGSGPTNAQGTPQPRGSFRGGGGMNNLFVDPLIQYLEEKANS